MTSPLLSEQKIHPDRSHRVRAEMADTCLSVRSLPVNYVLAAAAALEEETHQRAAKTGILGCIFLF